MIEAFTFVQATPATTWLVDHNFQTAPISDVQVLHNGKIMKILPMAVKHISETQLSIQFSTPYAGQARIIGQVENPSLVINSIDPGIGHATGAPAPVMQSATYVYKFREPITTSSPLLWTRHPTYTFSVYKDGLANPATVVSIPQASVTTVGDFCATVEAQLGTGFSCFVTPLTLFPNRVNALLTIAREGETFALGAGNVFDYGSFYEDTDNNSETASPFGEELPLIDRVAPTAEFAADNLTPDVDANVTFTAEDPNAAVYRWDDGSGFKMFTTTNVLNISYSEPGAYYVSLEIANAYGENLLTKTNYITVPNNVVPEGWVSYMRSANAMTYLSVYQAAHANVSPIDGAMVSNNRAGVEINYGATAEVTGIYDEDFNVLGDRYVLSSEFPAMYAYEARLNQKFNDDTFGGSADVHIGFFSGEVTDRLVNRARGTTSGDRSVIYSNFGIISSGGASVGNAPAPYGVGDIIGVVVDIGNSVTHFYKNGTFIGSAPHPFNNGHTMIGMGFYG